MVLGLKGCSVESGQTGLEFQLYILLFIYTVVEEVGTGD